MRKQSRRSQQFRRADERPAAAPLAPRWYDGAWLPMLSAVLLTLAFAPISQFYLAWVGLVPLLLFVRRAATMRRLFLWAWAGGTLFFGLNIWLLGFVTVPGTLGSFLYMGFYWGLAAVLLRVLGMGTAENKDGRSTIENGERREMSRAILHPPSSILAPFVIAAVWTATEWVRGNLGTGWPWSFLGYTQTPLLVMCQVADVVGVHGVTFWLVAVNVVVMLLVIGQFRVRPLLGPIAGVGAILGFVLVYGIVRMAQTETTPGPRVMVVQSNYPQSNTGRKSAEPEELVAFHVKATRNAVAAEQKAGRTVDLVVWSETMMPTINQVARDFTRGSRLGQLLDHAYQELASLTFDTRTALLTGGSYAGTMAIHDGMYVDLDRRNAAYFFEPTGVMSDLRYDKIHLVPFGEYVPFKDTIPPLYRFFMWFSPYEYDYNLVPGNDDALTVFTLNPPIGEIASRPASSPTTRAKEMSSSRPSGSRSAQPHTLAGDSAGAGAEKNRDADKYRDGSYFWSGEGARFVVPICFEDADPRLLARMFRPDGTRPGKRADFIVNITNDGWFSQPQLSQHLQIARFRSIENRVPTARSVNTGISAFINSVGRVYDRLPAHVEGTLASTLPLDPRLTIYTRIGDAFAIGCTTLIAILAGWALLGARRRPRVAAVEP